MAVSEVIQIDPADRANLDRAIERIGDARPLMERIGGIGEDAAGRTFKTQSGPDGKPWKPSIRAQLQGTATLIQGGRLRDSIVSKVSADQVEVGTNVIYAAIHQFGMAGSVQVRAHNRLIRQAFGRPLRAGVYQTVAAFSRKVATPARPFLGVNDQDRGAIARAVQRFIEMGSAA
ncbi:phage virion morphogenesis protein [Rhizobium sp. CRIBSB]|nr:phage virion morphogenesis protein [Rhizobium sp. CRIBSB]